MNTIALPLPRADRALDAAARTWLATALAGQAVFAFYVLVFYGGAALQGQPERWRQVLTKGWIAGDPFGNLVLAAHLLFTVVIVAGGALQLWPAVRRHAPAVHRWNGRLYLVAAMVLAVGGLLMVWTRGTVGDLSQHLGTSTNAVVIGVCAAMAWRHARARRVDLHRRWALRLFIAVGGVWFFRIGLMAWIVANRGPVGFDPKTFEGPFLTALAWGQFIVPLALLELYFRVRAQRGAALHAAAAAGLGVLTLLTLAGIGAATMILWAPRL